MEGEIGRRDMEKRSENEGEMQRRGQCECNGAGLPSQLVGTSNIRKAMCVA